VHENRGRRRAEQGLKLANADLERRVEERTASLRDERKRLEAIVRTAAEGIFTLDERGLVESVNPAAEHMFGYGSSEIVGCGVDTLMPSLKQKKLDQEVADRLKRANANHTEISHEVSGCRKDGTVFPADLAVSQFVLDGERKLVAMVRDITLRKRADEMRNRLAAIVESADDAIISKSLEGIIGSWNTGAEKLFGYSAAEAVGRSISMLIPEELRDEESQMLQTLIRGERIEHYDTVRLHKNGSRINVSLNISPLRDEAGKVIGASKIARDITERVRLEMAVTSATEEERGHIARDLHDGLGQELGGALFLSDLLQRDLKHRQADEAARAAEVHGLVAKALAQAREVSRGLYPVPAEPDGLMTALQNLADRVARDRQIDCTFDADCAVLLSDRTLATHLYRIAQEAVSNSLKHSGAKCIEIKLARTDVGLVLSVRDYGAGLAEGTLRRGLGLETMTDRARLVGGQLRVENAEGGGVQVTCFVRKPLASFRAAVPEPEPKTLVGNGFEKAI